MIRVSGDRRERERRKSEGERAEGGKEDSRQMIMVQVRNALGILSSTFTPLPNTHADFSAPTDSLSTVFNDSAPESKVKWKKHVVSSSVRRDERYEGHSFINTTKI